MLRKHSDCGTASTAAWWAKCLATEVQLPHHCSSIETIGGSYRDPRSGVFMQ